MKKSIILITAILAMTLTATHAFSYGGQGRGKGNSGKGMAMHQSAWNDLSKEQRDEITGLRQQFIDETYELRSDMMLKRHQVRMLMETSNPDRAELIKLSKAVNEIENRIMEKRIDFVLAAKKVAPELKFAPGSGQGLRVGCGGKGARGFGGGQGQRGECLRN